MASRRFRSSSKFRDTRLSASRQASFGAMPCRMFSTTVCAPQTRRFSSPRPVEPAPPTSWSSQRPPPMIGESPTRPGIFHARPLVVVTADISPFSFRAMQLMVPCGGWMAFSQASASNSSLAWGNISLISWSTAPLRCSLGGASNPGPQLVCPLPSRSDFFQVSHCMRESSVSRLSSWNPMSLANRSAPSPTSIMWSVCSITNRATLEGVLILRSAPTAPPRREGPCMQLASSSTTPSSFGSPPYPTLVSLGSSSTMLTPAMTASSVSPPPLTISMALAQQFTPPLLRLALDMTTAPGRACATAGFRDGTQRQDADLTVNGKLRGCIEVVYAEGKTEFPEGPFLAEERSLIDTVAREVALI